MGFDNAKKLNSYRGGYQLNSPVLFKSVKTVNENITN